MLKAFHTVMVVIMVSKRRGAIYENKINKRGFYKFLSSKAYKEA